MTADERADLLESARVARIDNPGWDGRGYVSVRADMLRELLAGTAAVCERCGRPKALGNTMEVCVVDSLPEGSGIREAVSGACYRLAWERMGAAEKMRRRPSTRGLSVLPMPSKEDNAAA